MFSVNGQGKVRSIEVNGVLIASVKKDYASPIVKRLNGEQIDLPKFVIDECKPKEITTIGGIQVGVARTEDEAKRLIELLSK